jgi:hypothetical protein
MADVQWQGMPHEEIDARSAEVPERPGGVRQGIDATVTYARVHFSGNYGGLCGQYQQLDRANITKEAAHQIAWAAFGMCSHQIIYYDAHGSVLDEEG